MTEFLTRDIFKAGLTAEGLIRLLGSALEVVDATAADTSTMVQTTGGDLVITPKNNLSVGSKKITDVATGTASTDAVNKAQLDAAVGGGGGGADEIVVSSTEPTDPAVELWLDTSGDVTPTASVVNSTASVSSASGTTSFVSTIPSGCATGDVLYLAMTCANTNSGSPLTITATGWTVLTSVADQGTTQRALYTAPWSAGLAGVTWAVGAAQRFGFVCVAVRNGRTAVVGATDLGASNTVLTCPSVTATGAGLALRLVVRKDNLSTSITAPGSSTTLQSVLGAAAGPASHVAAYSQVQAAAGSTGTATVTFSVASANGTAWTVAV